MKKHLFILLLITFTLIEHLSTYAQVNFVPNSSFENYTTCPDFSGQLNYVNNWNNVNLVYSNFSYGSPDFYHTCSQAPLASLPVNNYGTVTAFDGDGVVGLVIYNFDKTDYREYMATQLTQPVTPENTYNIKLRITGGINQNYRFHSSNFGIVFSQSPLSQTTWSIINAIPQVEFDTLLNTPNWTELSFTYTPDKSYSFLTLGSFRHDADINAVNSMSSSNKYSYVYIDAIEIKNASETGIQDISKSNIKVQYHNQSLMIANPDNEMVQKVMISDSQGRAIQTEIQSENSYNSIGFKSPLVSGIYFATIFINNKIETFKFVVIN